MTQLPVFLVLAAFAGDPQPGLQPGAAIPAPLLDPCATAVANATATLGADDDDDVLSSGTAAYASQRKCTRFVADFKVLAGANPADNHGIGTFDVGGGATSSSWATTKSVCESLEVNLTVYKKAAGANGFGKMSSAAYKGVWNDGPLFDLCSLQKTSGDNPPSGTANPAGTDTWRVAVRATQGNAAVPVSARVAFQIVAW